MAGGRYSTRPTGTHWGIGWCENNTTGRCSRRNPGLDPSPGQVWWALGRATEKQLGHPRSHSMQTGVG